MSKHHVLRPVLRIFPTAKTLSAQRGRKEKTLRPLRLSGEKALCIAACFADLRLRDHVQKKKGRNKHRQSSKKVAPGGKECDFVVYVLLCGNGIGFPNQGIGMESI